MDTISLRALLALSIIVLCCKAQDFHVGRLVTIAPEDSLVFLNNDGEIVKKFDPEKQVLAEFTDQYGQNPILMAADKNMTIPRIVDAPIDYAKLPTWYDNLRQNDLKRRKHYKELNPNELADESDIYDNVVVVNSDGSRANRTYSDGTMQISIINDKATTTIDMKKGFDLKELKKNKAAMAKYRSYDGQKKCRTNRYDKAIIEGLRNGKLSRINITEDGRFLNPFSTWEQPSLMQTLKFFFIDDDESAVPEEEEALNKVLPLLKPDFRVTEQEFEHFRVTWIGHSTLLIQINGLNILTDPVFSERASPSQLFGPKRIRRTPCTIEELPKIDIVLISHNHYDHMDLGTITKLDSRFGRRIKWVVPLGVGPFMKYYGIENYIEMDWWQKDCHPIPPHEFINGYLFRQDPLRKPDMKQVYDLQNASQTATAFSARTAARFLGFGFGEGRDVGEIAIYFTPTQHNSRRGVLDYNLSLWGSYTIVSKNNGTFFFTGDTGYCPVFNEIGDVFGPFSGAAIPIGAYQPRHFLRVNHINPQEAVQLHSELRSQKSISIHHSTFILSYEPFKEPARLLNRLMKDYKNRTGVEEPFNNVKHGETILFCTNCKKT